jgi:hypothetical protein
MTTTLASLVAALAGCAGRQSDPEQGRRALVAPPTSSSTEPTKVLGGDVCIPILPHGFAVPDSWIIKRGSDGELALVLRDQSAEVWAHVIVERVERCMPLEVTHRDANVPVDAAFGPRYAVDLDRIAITVTGSGREHSQACVEGDYGALLVDVGYYPTEVARAHARTLLARLAEATDGMHRCYRAR